MGWKRATISVSPRHSLPVSRGEAHSLKTGLPSSQLAPELPQPLLSPQTMSQDTASLRDMHCAQPLEAECFVFKGQQ